MVRHLVAYVSCCLIAALICAIVGGFSACISSLCASAIYILPSGCMMLVSWLLSRHCPAAGPIVFQIGLFARGFIVIGLMLALALTYNGLNWPAFIFTLFMVASAPVAGQFLLKQ